MSSSGVGIWLWSRSGLGTVPTVFCLKSPASMKRRFDVGAGSWPRRWRTARSIEFGCRVAAGHQRKKDLSIVATLQELVEPETAGDPMTGRPHLGTQQPAQPARPTGSDWSSGERADRRRPAEGSGLCAARQRQERCTSVGGDFFADVSPGGDAYLLAQIPYDWGDAQNPTILSRCHSAMPAHARLLVVELVLPETDEPNIEHGGPGRPSSSKQSPRCSWRSSSVC